MNASKLNFKDMKVSLLLSLIIFQLGFSQQRSCGTDLYMQQMMSNPVAKQKHLDLQNKFEIELRKLQDQQNKSVTNTNATIIIPVAVHFPNVAANSIDKPCLRQLAQNQIDILNADFNATNSDIALWTPTASAFYPGTNVGILNVRFVIATQNHPAGTGLANGQAAVTFGSNYLANSNYDTQWSNYLNFVVRDLGGSIIGLSPIGGNPSAGGAVYIAPFGFGSGAGCSSYQPTPGYNLGRTLSHELGHFFNLYHTFGNDQCNDQNTDYVNDTPQCRGFGGCALAGEILGCVAGEKSLTVNYLDYTQDACMYMFTAGQVTRMRAYYNAIASQFAINVLSSNDFEFNNFVLYPNPNNGSFKISFTPKTNDNIEIVVNDISGRTIYDKSFQNSGVFDQELNMNTISSSVYFVNIQNGVNKMTRKIIIKN